MSVSVFARTPRSARIADLVEARVEEFLNECIGSPTIHAHRLADGADHFRLNFPRALGLVVGVHNLAQHVDVYQVVRETWDQMERMWKGEWEGVTPREWIDQGGPAIEAAMHERPPSIHEVDDVEIESAAPDDVHLQMFEGTARSRKGKLTELGIRPNAMTGEIMPESSSSPIQVDGAGTVKKVKSELTHVSKGPAK